MSNKKKLAVFDLDGTLLNTLDDLASSTNHALVKFGFPPHDTESYKLRVGNGMLSLIYNSLPIEKRDDDELVKDVKAAMMEHYAIHCFDKTAPYTGIGEMLEKLAAKGVLCAVLTNKAQKPAEAIINRFFGIGTFAAVLGDNPPRRRKPEPDGVFEIMRLVGVNDISEVVYLGDSGGDAVTAKNAGCDFIACVYGFRSFDELYENGARVFADKPENIADLILKY